MDMRNWNGTDGLPPLDDDDNTRDFFRKLFAPLSRSGKFRLPSGPRACGIAGCASAAQEGAPYCGKHLLSETFDAIYGGGGDTDAAYPELPGWPDRRPAYVELPEPQTPQASDVWPRTYGAPIHSILDDQCRYCRAILIELGEQGEPLPALSASAQFARYMCPRHIQRNVALALTLDRIDDLMRTTPTRRGLSSAEVARTVDASGGGYLMLSDK